MNDASLPSEEIAKETHSKLPQPKGKDALEVRELVSRMVPEVEVCTLRDVLEPGKLFAEFIEEIAGITEDVVVP